MIAPLRRALPLAAAGLLGAGALSAQPVVNLPTADRALAGTPAPVFAVGQEEGQSWEMLSSVEAAAFDAQENLYVLDRGNQRVLVFDRAGRYVRQMGKEGDGPGELRVPLSMAVAADGTVTVADIAQRRFNVFRRDGTFARSMPFDEAGSPLRGIAAHPAGGVVGIFRALPMMGDRVQTPQAGTFAVPASTLLRLPLAAGAQPVRFHQFADATQGRQTVDGAGGTRRMMRVTSGPPTFGPRQLWGVLPDGGVALANGTGYNLRLLNAAGQPIRTLRRPIRTRLVTEADRNRARTALRERMSSGEGAIVVTVGGGGGGPAPRGRSPQMIEESVRNMRFADTVAVLRSLYVAPSGTLWIGRNGPQGDDEGPIDLVTAAGEYRGTLPRGLRMPLAVSPGGRAVWVERDELEVERVVVRQLPATWR